MSYITLSRLSFHQQSFGSFVVLFVVRTLRFLDTIHTNLHHDPFASKSYDLYILRLSCNLVLSGNETSIHNGMMAVSIPL